MRIGEMTFTQIDEDTWTDANGGEWVAWEAKDMERKIRWAEKEQAEMVAAGLTELDNALAYDQAREIEMETREDLRILEILFA